MYSVSTFLERHGQFSHEEKLAIKKQGRPTPNILFEGKRQCNLPQQYAKHKWLCGCAERKAFFCFPCLIFKPNSQTVWTTSGVKDLSNLTNSTSKHEKTSDHASACMSLALLGNIACSRQPPQVGRLLPRDLHNQEVRANREILRHHIDMVMFLVKQGLPFQSQHEYASSDNRGNFVEGVQLLTKYSSNSSLRNLINNGGEFTGLTPDVQNDLVSSIFTEVSHEIQKRVAESPFVSIRADETDIGDSSLMCVSVRIVRDGDAQEHVIGLCDIPSDRSAQRIMSALVATLRDNAGITADSKVVAQTYDAVSNVKGLHDSVSKYIQGIWPSAHFTHCYAHKWSLVVRQACASIPDVAFLFGCIDSIISYFRASLKRSFLLEANLPRTSSTRWKSRSSSIETFDKHYYEIRSVLTAISSDSSFDAVSRSDARGHAMQLRNLTTVFLLKLFRLVLGYADLLNTYLESQNLDPVVVSMMVLEYKQKLLALRNEEHTFRDVWTSTAAVLEESVVKRPKLENACSVTDFAVGDEGRCRGLTQEIADRLLQQVNDRFHEIDRFAWIKVLQVDNFPCLLTEPVELRCLISLFSSQYPSLVEEPEKLKVELQALYSDPDVSILLTHLGVTDCVGLLKFFVERNLQDALPGVYTMLMVAATLPLINVNCGRKFSVLKRVKTYRQNAALHKCMKPLLLLGTEKSVLDSLSGNHTFYDRVIDVFDALKDRPIRLRYRAK